MNIIFCGIRDDVQILSKEIGERHYYGGEFIENSDTNISIKKLIRAISRNDTLIIDLDFIDTTTSILFTLAEEHNLEIIGYYHDEKPQNTRYSAICDVILHIDDVIDYID